MAALAGRVGSQYRTEHRDGIIPKSARDWPLGDRLAGDLVRLGQICLLTAAHFGGEGGIAEQDVVLVVQVKTASVHVGGPDQADLAIQRERLGVKEPAFEFKNANPGRQRSEERRVGKERRAGWGVDA